MKIPGIKNLEKGIGLNILAAGTALLLTWIFDGPRMDIEHSTALILALPLLTAGAVLIVFAILRSKQKRGVYKLIRYPIYSAIVFLINPALSIWTRSWLYLGACVAIYFIWRALSFNEDRATTKENGDSHRQYRLKTSPLFPSLYSINRPLFFTSAGILIFAATFILLNFASLSFRYVSWKSETQPASPPAESQIANGPFSLPSFLLFSEDKNSTPDNNSQPPKQTPDSENNKTPSGIAGTIVIKKMGLTAPIILSAAKTDKELNNDLNKGVIIYPGSVMPGENGELFLTGHSSVYPWNKTQYGRVFAALDKLEKGDIISISYNDKQYDYIIESKHVSLPKDVSLQSAPGPTLTLMTCWPIGTNLKRLIVEGKLVN
jgi:LPXTG-site transpeptidase (sortase) family protein